MGFYQPGASPTGAVVSEDPSRLPEPFADVVADRRTDEQRSKDAAGARKQVAFFFRRRTARGA